MNETRFFDVNSLSEYIHLSKSTIYKMVRSNRIPHIKMGSRTLFDRYKIDSWVLSGGELVGELPELR